MGLAVSSRRNQSTYNSSPELRAGLEKRLLAYALGAAGVAALSPSANASIVYTKVNVTIVQGILPIDLNQDGQPDFALHNYWVGSSSSIQAITIKGNPLNSAAAVIGHKNFFQYANAVPLNYSIGSKAKSFVNVEGDRAYLGGGITNKFLGLRFSINGETHYGWARITTRGHGIQLDTIRLTGFAYETTPNKAILAGDQGPNAAKTNTEAVPGEAGPSLAMLSLGAPGLDVWRRTTE